MKKVSNAMNDLGIFLNFNILKGNIIEVQVITPLKMMIVKLNKTVKIQILREAGNELRK